MPVSRNSRAARRPETVILQSSGCAMNSAQASVWFRDQTPTINTTIDVTALDTKRAAFSYTASSARSHVFTHIFAIQREMHVRCDVASSRVQVNVG